MPFHPHGPCQPCWGFSLRDPKGRHKVGVLLVAGKALESFGRGEEGRQEGAFDHASFHEGQSPNPTKVSDA